jgi:hypothetical protein
MSQCSKRSLFNQDEGDATKGKRAKKCHRVESNASNIESIRQEQIADAARMNELKDAMALLQEKVEKQQWQMVRCKEHMQICRVNAKSIDDELEGVVHHVCNILQVLESVDSIQRRRQLRQ